MNYKTEQYMNTQRFNGQYEEIYHFLLKTADNGYNEHFHWGRFEWMMCHTFLDVHKLEKIALFRDENNLLAGLVTYDTCFDDSVYLIHAATDKKLLKIMIDYAVQNYKINGKTVIKVNGNDTTLIETLQENSFVKTNQDNTVLEISLEQDMDNHVPEGFHISPPDFMIDHWHYQNVLHKGFNQKGDPQPWNEELLKPAPNENNALKVFIYNETEYCSHCGIWYTQGETAYIEPVVTIPAFRNAGLAKAAVYKAVSRAKKLGAKRAIVLSGQEFYFHIGFAQSFGVYCWEKESKA